MITMQGTVPYPPTANAANIQALSANLRGMSGQLFGSATSVAATANATQQSWVGQAGDAFRNHLAKRSATVSNISKSIGNCAPILDTYAAAILSTQAAYSAAAVVEKAAMAAIPFSSAAVAAAIAAEAAAVAALQAAGVVCAGALVVIELQIIASELLGVSREAFLSIKDAAVDIWDDVSEAVEEGDIDAAVSALNRTVEIPNASGGSTRYNPMGMLIDAIPTLDRTLDITQIMLGAGVLLTAPALSAMERPDLVDELTDHGFTLNPTTAAQHGTNMALLEQLQRRPGEEIDQSVAIFHTRGTELDGDQVLNLTIPGIVPPSDRSIFGDSGSRNVLNAAGSQITGYGIEEDTISEWVLAQNLPPGSTVNMFAHSQGGIVARNVGNTLSDLGYNINVVSYGSPDGQFNPGVDAYIVQNTRDPIPLTRLGGDGGSVQVFSDDQRLIQFDHELVDGSALDHHGAEVYGDFLDANPELSADTLALQAFIADQQHVVLDTSATGVVVLEGPETPQGTPVTVPEPYDIPDTP